jgi:limonene-1,2-epoxide hydrolase
MQAMQKFTSFYRHLDQESLSRLDELYAQDVVFIDPVTRHQGLFELSQYFSTLMENTQNCSFNIYKTNSSEETNFVTWQMTFQHKKLKAGQVIRVDGVSELQIVGNKICYQRDYYDMGEMIYENIPLLGSVIKTIKRRLTN